MPKIVLLHNVWLFLWHYSNNYFNMLQLSRARIGNQIFTGVYLFA
jgi:hypothetical protein